MSVASKKFKTYHLKFRWTATISLVHRSWGDSKPWQHYKGGHWSFLIQNSNHTYRNKRQVRKGESWEVECPQAKLPLEKQLSQHLEIGITQIATIRKRRCFHSGAWTGKRTNPSFHILQTEVYFLPCLILDCVTPVRSVIASMAEPVSVWGDSKHVYTRATVHTAITSSECTRRFVASICKICKCLIGFVVRWF